MIDEIPAVEHGATRSMSASISEISSEKPGGNDVSPELDVSNLASPFFALSFASFRRFRRIINRPITSVRHKRTAAVTEMIRYR